MLKAISSRASGSHVSLSAHYTPSALTLTHYQQLLQTREEPRPRPFTTTSILRNATQSAPRKLDVFIPSDDTLGNPFPIITQKSDAGHKSLNGLSSSVLKPITTHHNLETYQAFQQQRLLLAPDAESRRKLNTSTVHLGTRYEYLIQSHLQSHLGFTLTRIGGRGDGGVDLIGTWTLPSPHKPAPSSSPQRLSDGPNKPTPTFRVLLQAKRIASNRKPMPALLRELDGTVLSASGSRWISAAFVTHNIRTTTQERSSTTLEQGKGGPLSDLSHLPTLGVLITTRPLTAGIERAMSSSRRCLMYVCLGECDDAHTQNGEDLDGHSTVLSIPSTQIRQMVWNGAASRAGLEGYNIVTKYSSDKDGSTTGEAVMLFQGQPLIPP